jgi:hypothetical protein
VHVRVDERRCDDEPAAFDDSMRVRVELGAERGDHAVVDAEVERLVDPFDRVEHACAAHDDVLLGCVLREQHQATTSSTASDLTPTGPLVSRS